MKFNENKIGKSKVYYIKIIETVLGKKEAAIFFNYFNMGPTLYELFKLITSNVKRNDLSKRYFLESFAGELIFSKN